MIINGWLPHASMIIKGQRYKAKQDIPVIAMTSWAAPFTGGYDRVLRAGEALRWLCVGAPLSSDVVRRDEEAG